MPSLHSAPCAHCCEVQHKPFSMHPLGHTPAAAAAHEAGVTGLLLDMDEPLDPSDMDELPEPPDFDESPEEPEPPDFDESPEEPEPPDFDESPDIDEPRDIDDELPAVDEPAIDCSSERVPFCVPLEFAPPPFEPSALRPASPDVA